MVEEIKRWIAERRLGPGDKLPKEDELQELFGVSKGTAREALKSLEVQGLVTVTTGPAGGATIIGQMVLAGGAWQGRQIVPAAWLEQSTSPAVSIEGMFRYGWHWYLLTPQGGGAKMISAVGWGGQRLFIMPALDLVVAMNCGNYSKPGMEQRRVADVLLRELVLPAVM